VGGERVAAIGEAKNPQQLLDAYLGLPPGEAVDLSCEKEVLSYREVVEEAEAFGQDTDAALDLKRTRGDIKPADGGLAGSGCEEP
jgi:hypothetical protein